MTTTDFPTTTLSTRYGNVRLLSNGGDILVSNHPQYDRDGNGVTDLVVRGIGHVVSVWIEADDFSLGTTTYRRADGFLVDSSPAARKALSGEITSALSAFLSTDEGRRFVLAGRVAAAEKRWERACEKSLEAHAAYLAARSERQKTHAELDALKADLSSLDA